MTRLSPNVKNSNNSKQLDKCAHTVGLKPNGKCRCCGYRVNKGWLLTAQKVMSFEDLWRLSHMFDGGNNE